MDLGRRRGVGHFVFSLVAFEVGMVIGLDGEAAREGAGSGL